MCMFGFVGFYRASSIATNTWIAANTRIVTKYLDCWLFPNLGGGVLSRANGQCLSLVNIPGCLTQVYGLLTNSQFSVIIVSCCNAISKIEENCLSKLFPSNPIFAPLLNNSCGQSSKGNRQISRLTTSKVALPELLPEDQDIQQCW